MEETWKAVVGFEGVYEVSSLGRIRVLERVVVRYLTRRAKILTGKRSWHGYHRVGLCDDRRSYTTQIHRIVAVAFIPNPKGKPFINHKDGNKLNNSVENLEWVTASENCKHAFQSGLSKGNFKTWPNNMKARLNPRLVRRIRAMVASGVSINAEANKMGCDWKTISNIITRRTWKHV